jgi:energy-coupling factor transporter ATP-binding protein EcfA2
MPDMIEIHNLTVRFPGRPTPVLEDLNLRFSAGSRTAMMGANGSGKSTLARCMNGLLQPEGGEVLVNEISTRQRPSVHEIRKSVGLVFQNPRFQMTSLTVEREIAFGLQNLGLPRSQILERVESALGELHLEEKRYLSPRSLSAGEQQRLSLASVFVLRPGFLILDEPTSLLSPAHRAMALEMVEREHARRGMGFLLITQIAEEALLADRLIVLSNGKVAADLPPRQAFMRPEDFDRWGIDVPLRFRVGAAS